MTYEALEKLVKDLERRYESACRRRRTSVWIGAFLLLGLAILFAVFLIDRWSEVSIVDFMFSTEESEIGNYLLIAGLIAVTNSHIADFFSESAKETRETLYVLRTQLRKKQSEKAEAHFRVIDVEADDRAMEFWKAIAKVERPG